MSTEQRTKLEVGMADLAIGEYSVGVAPSRTSEQLVSAYIELITLVRQDLPDYLRNDDFEALAETTSQDASFFRNRVLAHLQQLAA